MTNAPTKRATLLDVLLPDTTGFEVAELLSSSEHPPAIVLTSTRSAADYGAKLDAMAADGFVSNPDLSVEAIEEALR